MNFTDAKHGALGAHLYLTPQGKSLPRRMRLQQNRPIRPWATEAKINLHRKHHTHQAKQVNGKTNTVVCRQFQKPRSRERSWLTTSLVSPKKRVLRKHRKRARRKKKIEPKTERYSDAYNALFMSEFLFKQTNSANSAQVSNVQNNSANKAQLNKVKSAPDSNVRKLPRNNSYVQVAEDSFSQMTQTSDLLISNTNFLSQEVESVNAWNLPSQKLQSGHFFVGESSENNDEQVAVDCNVLQPETTKSSKSHTIIEKSKGTDKHVLVHAVHAHGGIIIDRLENILLTATHQIISIITNGLSIMVFLPNILGDGLTYQYDDISCRLEECRDPNVNTVERLKYLCSDIKFEATNGSDLEEKMKLPELDEGHQNKSTHVYLPIQNGSQFVGILVVQVAEMDDALHLHHRATTDTLFKQYIYNMAISIDNCRYEEGFVEKKGQEGHRLSGHIAAEASRSYKKVFDLQTQVDDLNIKLRASGITGGQVPSLLRKEKRQDLPHQDNSSTRKDESKPMSIDDLSGSIVSSNVFDKPIDIDNEDLIVKENVIHSLRAYSRRIKNLHKVLEQEYEEIMNHKSYLREKTMNLDQQSLHAVKSHELSDATESGAAFSPRNLEKEWQELDAQRTDVNKQKHDLILLQPYLKELDDSDKNMATKYASSFGISLQEQNSNDRQLVSSSEFDAAGFKPIRNNANLLHHGPSRTPRRKKKSKNKGGKDGKQSTTKKKKKNRWRRKRNQSKS